MNIPQYITQLTKEWFASVSKKPVQGTCIQIEENGDSRIVSVDVSQLRTFLDCATEDELAELEEDVAALSDAVEEINTDLGALEEDFDDLHAALYPSGTKDWVDLTSAQTVGGVKTFTNDVLFSTSIGCRSGLASRFHICGGNTYTEGAHIVLNGLEGSLNPGCFECKTNGPSYTLIGSNNGSLKWSGTTTDTTSTTDTQLPKLGYINDKFSRKTHHHDDVYSKLGHTHSGYASTNHTHSGYASTNHNHNGVYANATHPHVAADISDLGSTIDGKITTFSSTVSETYATISELNSLYQLVEEIDYDLSETIVEVGLINIDVDELFEWHDTGKSVTLQIGGAISWDGTKITQQYNSVTFYNGLITDVGQTSTKTINTVTYNPQ